MILTETFIDQLTSNTYFLSKIQKIFNLNNQLKNSNSFQQPFKIQNLIDQISSIILQNFESNIKSQCNHLYQSNHYILDQIQDLKKKISFSQGLKQKTESSTAQKQKSMLETSIFFQNDHHFNLNSMRQELQNLNYDLNDPKLSKSFSFQQQSKLFIDCQVEEKINNSISQSVHKLQSCFQQKFSNFIYKTEQRIQQLKRTVASIIQSLNERFPLKPQQFLNKNVKETQKNHELLNEKNKNSIKKQENSGKIAQVLNKSINMSRGKIKSFFGYSNKQFEEKHNKNSTKLFS